MLSTWFATPALLWSLLAIPAALAWFVYAHFRRRQMTSRLATPLLLRKGLLVRPRIRRWKSLCTLVALSLTALACAGPQWGLDPSAQFRKGRDVIVVLDLSRSMLAEQPSRQEFALRALHNLANTLEDHGGNRVAFIGFAAQPRLFFPLTQDCDHLRHTLAQIRGDDYPSLKVEEPISGTRFGAALKLASDSCDSDRAHRPIIVLLSDGDDPADDDEWLQGVQAAIEKKLKVHVVGVGDPNNAETIPVGRDRLQFEGEPIRTKLNELRLREIARRTGGEYLPAHREEFPLGAYILNLLDREELLDEPTSATLPVQQLRYAWFLLPAAFLFILTMLLSEGWRPTRSRAEAKLPALLFTFAAIVSISAADPPFVESLLREADDAFALQEYEIALGLYEKAENLTQDPGRLSFNKAAAYYRLERYREAIDSYRRCLEDDAAPPERRARACFDLGNALVKHADGDAGQLTEAVKAYRAALHLADVQTKWQSGARHNLELAQMLLLDARKKQPDVPPIPKKNPEKQKPDENDSKKKNSVLAPVDPDKGFKPETSKDVPKGGPSNKLTSGAVPQVLPDREQVAPLSPEQTLATLAEHARRIAEARRQQRNGGGAVELSTKDW